MNKINYKRLRKIHRVLLYIVFAIVGYLFFAMLISAAELYEFPFREIATINTAILLIAGIPMLILSTIIILIGHPADDYTLENPFLSLERLETHFKVKLDERNYDAPIVLADESEMKITVRRKSVLNRIRVFAIMHAPVLDSSVAERMQELIIEYLSHPSGSPTKVFLTMLLCVEDGSGVYPSMVRHFGQSLSIYVVTVGFDFEKCNTSFQGKIDGLVAGKRKQMLKSFLSMLPEAQKYLDLEYLEGKERMNRDRIVWPFNPKKIPRWIRLLWGISSFAIALLTFLIGFIIISNAGIVFVSFAVLVFVYAFFMIGVGIYQLKNAIVQDDGMRKN